MLNESDKLLTPVDVSARWRISVKTLANWRTQKKGPKYVKLGGQRNQRVFYRVEDILDYEQRHIRGEI